MIEAAIFDIDGTLLDSVDLHAQAWEEAFRHFGHELPLPEIRRQIGKGSDKLLPVFLKPEEIERMGEDLTKYRGDLFKKKYLAQVKPFPGVRELVKRIQDDGKQVALASSAKGDEIEDFKRIAKIDDLVKKEASSDDAKESKPAPDIFSAALKKLKLSAAQAVAIGDTPYDAEAAGKIQISTIGVLCGGWSQQELRDSGCAETYRDALDLLKNYETSMLGARVPVQTGKR